jgi:hypothetical protein
MNVNECKAMQRKSVKCFVGGIDRTFPWYFVPFGNNFIKGTA